MNVEFQIHGVLSSGQARWKQEDKDYYTQFYSGQSVDTLMIVEIVNRPHGISTYYNYLLNNIILSARDGSYFGMTVRIDGAFCKDVKSIYMILDNLYNKMIVGNVLLSKNNGKYEYSIDSFSTYSDYLKKVEAQFSNMFNAFFSPQDFVEISENYASQGSKLSINASEITIPTAIEAVKQRAKIYLSPEYQSKYAQQKIDEANAKAKAAQDDANARIEAAEQTHNKSRLQRESEYESWKKEKKALEEARDKAINNYKELQQKIQTADLNRSIIDKIAEVKQPIIQLAGLMASRFPENSKNSNKKVTPFAEKNRKGNILGVWLPWAICGILALALACSIWFMGGAEGADQSFVIKKQQERIEQLEKVIKDMSNPSGAKEQQVGTDETGVNTGELAKYDLSKLGIDIQGCPGPGQLKHGKTYTCRIKGGDYPMDGYWVIIDGERRIQGNSFKVESSPGAQVIITYYHGTDVITERTENVH